MYFTRTTERKVLKKEDQIKVGDLLIIFFPAEPIRAGLPLIISALSILGVGNHHAMTESWELLNAKKDEEGRLKIDGTLSKFPYNFGKVGDENKWVTFYALLAEKYRTEKH